MHHHPPMPNDAGLNRYDIIAFVNIVDADRAKHFYRDVLGLRLAEEALPFALVFDAHGTMLRLSITQKHSPLPGTVLGWHVPDITAVVRDLKSAGVQLERFEGMNQDELGIWSSPSGAKVAWFKDPDGNMLSVSQHP